MIRLTVSFVMAFLLIVSCKNKQEKLKPAEEKITESVYASGILKSNDQYQVFASVNGLVAEIFVTEGAIVQQGDALMRLANTTAQLNTENAGLSADYAAVAANSEKLNELKIAIDLAKEKMDNDASLLQRQQNLWKENIGTRNEVDLRDITLKSSVNAWEAAKLRYSTLQKQISFQAKQSQKNLQISKSMNGDYTIRSGRNGKVYSIVKEKGEMVNTQSLVALIGDAAAFTLALQVDEYDIARVKTGQQIFVSMDSYKGQVFEAVVEKIYPIMNDRTKSFTVDGRFVKQPAALYPNLTCEANIVIQQKDKALLIPRNYLLEGDYVLLPNKEKKKVTVGLKDYQQVEILSGLSVNDYILKPAL